MINVAKRAIKLCPRLGRLVRDPSTRLRIPLAVDSRSDLTPHLGVPRPGEAIRPL